MLIGQLDEIRDNSGKPVRILIHQAVACPFELNQPGGVYSLGENKCILRRRYDIFRAGDYKGGRLYIEPSRSQAPGQVAMAWAWRWILSGSDVSLGKGNHS